ncbi:uncharacterized protein BJX67DRAFT_362194 [Aspergillus lucknowensis]|uniref:Uncharacterized protein n=1 Tax=Aspergillus lucknowensis TaxID=176173 RepID=A0ABR4LHG3_9EURO
MKSPLYLLTAILPFTLALPSEEIEDNVHSLEERASKCKSNHEIKYYKWPCQQTGKYNPNENVEYQCKWSDGDWYKTSKNWWVKGSDVPNKCKKNLPNCKPTC